MNKIQILLGTVAVIGIMVCVAPVAAQEPGNDEGITGNELADETMEDRALGWIYAVTADYTALGTAILLAVQILKVAGSYLKLPDGYAGIILIVMGAIATGLAYGAKILDRQAELESWAGIAEQVGATVLNILVAFGLYKFADKKLKVFRGFLLPAWKRE